MVCSGPLYAGSMFWGIGGLELRAAATDNDNGVRVTRMMVAGAECAATPYSFITSSGAHVQYTIRVQAGVRLGQFSGAFHLGFPPQADVVSKNQIRWRSSTPKNRRTHVGQPANPLSYQEWPSLVGFPVFQASRCRQSMSIASTAPYMSQPSRICISPLATSPHRIITEPPAMHLFDPCPQKLLNNAKFLYCFAGLVLSTDEPWPAKIASENILSAFYQQSKNIQPLLGRSFLELNSSLK